MKIKSLLFLSYFSIAVSSNFYAQNIPGNVPLNGLVGWWPMDSSANDMSVNGNNGTIYGATLTTDRFGNANSAFLFNGLSDYIEVPDDSALDLSNSFTLASWIKTNDYNQPLQYAIGKGRGPSGTGYALAFYDPNQGVIALNDGSSNLFIGSADSSLVSGWHLVVGTYDGTTLKIYIDGTVRDSVSAFVNLINSTEPLCFGREASGIGRYFNGSLDDIGIWDRPLTACEIASLYSENNTVLTAPSGSICFGDTIIISASNAVSYNWQPGNLSGDSILVSPSATTTFSIVAINSLGCASVDSITVFVNLLPSVSASSNAPGDSICSGNQVTLNGSGATNYSWSGGITDGVGFAPSSTQTYTVTGTDTNGCNNSAPITITVNACLGVSGQTLSENINVFPNPAKEKLNIDLAKLTGNKVIEVMDVTGRMTDKFNTSANAHQLNLETYSEGNYFLRIYNNEKVFQVKFFIQR